MGAGGAPIGRHGAPRGTHGRPWGAHWGPWGGPGSPLGPMTNPWGPKGRLFGAHEGPSGAHGGPRGAHGAPLGTHGGHGGPLVNPIYQKNSRSTAPCGRYISGVVAVCQLHPAVRVGWFVEDAWGMVRKAIPKASRKWRLTQSQG